MPLGDVKLTQLWSTHPAHNFIPLAMASSRLDSSIAVQLSSVLDRKEINTCMTAQSGHAQYLTSLEEVSISASLEKMKSIQM